MNTLRNYILILFLGLCFQQSYSQSYRFKTSGFSVLEKNERGKWGEWSNLDLVNLSVILDTDKHRIVVYSQEIQLFNIIEYIEREENDTDIVYSFLCKDKNICLGYRTPESIVGKHFMKLQLTKKLPLIV